MAKNTRFLLVICLVSIISVILLQFYWVNNYYRVSIFNFEREVNLAYEDAIKKDFQLRCDTIEELLLEQLMDTNQFIIESTRFKEIAMVFNVYDAKNRKDYTSFSRIEFKDSLRKDDTAYKRQIARAYAHALRSEDLENHVVYYRIQSLGHFVSDKVKEYGFDTNRLRPVFDRYLRQRNISTPYYFYTRPADSLLNHIDQNDSLKSAGYVVTKSFTTYKWWNQDERYVRAVFNNPVNFVIGEMKWVLAGSLLLIILVAFCIGLLVRAFLNEKRLGLIKNEFINNITHELKTPIATVSAAVEALENEQVIREPEKVKRYLYYSSNELKRLSRLVDNILNISLYEKTSLNISKEEFYVNIVVRDVMEQLILSSNKKIMYTLTNDDHADTVNADKQLFTQAVMNILDNAIKYSPENVIINVRCYKEGDFFCISCTDKGIGIQSTAVTHVFDKFYRVPQNGHTVKGHGLGLSYVQQIVKAHGGKISLKSIENKGTTVILYWPL
ncbi:sensor histidine kinase [Gynurincola endophyticus]|uniref:sensor histidine kinase n=1 Tax=Gynurincola endophyticus TaxID=2479004 RepID=UPI000F8F6048|nr:HAMP domain-containing sensor histidine kinase [Gynurincola endophyticus]